MLVRVPIIRLNLTLPSYLGKALLTKEEMFR